MALLLNFCVLTELTQQQPDTCLGHSSLSITDNLSPLCMNMNHDVYALYGFGGWRARIYAYFCS